MFKQFLIEFVELFKKGVVIQEGKIKYPINSFILSREITSVPLSKLKNRKNYLFYTTHEWTTKNNNYIYDKNKLYYYIIEPGYYYYLHGECELTVNNEIYVQVFI